MQADTKSLTGLRFFAAFAIVLDHMLPVFFKNADGSPMFIEASAKFATLGMSMFFVMSGFIIHYVYSTTILTMPRGMVDFLIARFARLYPLYIALLAFDLIAGNFFLYASHVERQPFYEALPYYITATQSWFFMKVGKYDLSAMYNFSVVSWSISTEFGLYIAYPAIALFLNRIRTPRTATIVAVACVFASTLLIFLVGANAQAIDSYAGYPSDSYFTNWLLYKSPYGRLPEFIAGATIAHAFMANGQKSNPLYGFLWAGIGILSIAAYFALPGRWLPLLPAIAAIIVGITFYVGPVSGFLSRKALVSLGDASYSIYLLHLVVITAIAPTIPYEPALANYAIVSIRSVVAVFLIFSLSLGVFTFYESKARIVVRRTLKGVAARIFALYVQRTSSTDTNTSPTNVAIPSK